MVSFILSYHNVKYGFTKVQRVPVFAAVTLGSGLWTGLSTGLWTELDWTDQNSCMQTVNATAGCLHLGLKPLDALFP